MEEARGFGAVSGEDKHLEISEKSKALNTIPEMMSLDYEKQKRDVDEAKYCLGLVTAAAVFSFGNINFVKDEASVSLLFKCGSIGLLTLSLIFGYFAYRSFYSAEQVSFLSRLSAIAIKHDLGAEVEDMNSVSVSRNYASDGNKMKNISALLMVLGLMAYAVPSGEFFANQSCGNEGQSTVAIFNYSDFGPQAMAYEFIGNEWPQWQPQGSANPDKNYDIKIVVFSDDKRDLATNKFQTDQSRNHDYRHVSFRRSIDYLNENLDDLELASQEGMAFGDLVTTLEDTKTRIQKEVCSE